MPFNLIACSPQAIAGEIGMDNVLDNIANSLFNGLLPAAWSKLAPATCKQLASWLEHLRVSTIIGSLSGKGKCKDALRHLLSFLAQLINQLGAKSIKVSSCPLIISFA